MSSNERAERNTENDSTRPLFTQSASLNHRPKTLSGDDQAAHRGSTSRAATMPNIHTTATKHTRPGRALERGMGRSNGRFCAGVGGTGPRDGSHEARALSHARLRAKTLADRLPPIGPRGLSLSTTGLRPQAGAHAAPSTTEPNRWRGRATRPPPQRASGRLEMVEVRARRR